MSPVAWRKPTRTVSDGVPTEGWAYGEHRDWPAQALIKLGWEPLYLKREAHDDHIRRVAKLHGMRATPKLLAFAKGVMA